ncbi:MAG: glutamate-1-semialdehyde 2,1-aminomutase [Sedimentisphaerales bacterium]|nr:glutamate-1-semialdehyde 2,1-aminomutase [Sedimentisphaerales bacterium]
MSRRPYDRSARAFEQACKLMPGGVNSPVRAYRAVEHVPVFIASGKGSRVYDVDGNQYIDYVCSWGALILGHAHPEVVKAVRDAAGLGTSYGAPTIAEAELAVQITSVFASIEKVRLVSSGTEAVMTAIRLARAYTGRDMIIKMEGCYHGHSDSLLVAAGSGAAEMGRPASAGVPQAVAGMTIVVPYNDLSQVQEAFRCHRGRIAAVIVEPVAANMGVIRPEPGYLEGLREICDMEGAVLLFDEVITGLRVALGGCQELYGIKADLTCLGKIVGGGLPLAAVGGSARIMDLLAPIGPVYQAGTLSGNPIATAAANATIRLLRQMKPYAQLEHRAAALEQGLIEAARAAGVPLQVNRVGSLMSCFFTDRPVRNLADVQSADMARFKRFFCNMLDAGIYLAPSGYEAMFLSTAHTQEDVERTIDAAKEAFSWLDDP